MKRFLGALALAVLAGALRAEGGSTIDDFELTSGEVRRVPVPPVIAAADSGLPPEYASDSSVFRMRSRGSDYGDVEVSLELLDLGLRAEPPQNAWDGVHLWLRYQHPAYLYAISVNRRDDRVVIKKKVPGGDSYGGTYLDLCETRRLPVPYGRWQQVSAAAVNRPDGSVRLTLRIDGKLVLEALDDGSLGGPPIARPGRIGLRADNADFRFRRLLARPAGSESARGR
ncbi:MAG: hypothetical protein HY553_06340 [Elusimicrobia bacterium]|nr:hypothetical protein [Elusimicrobiota bacterium]